MAASRSALALVLALALGGGGLALAAPAVTSSQPTPALTAFKSDADLRTFLRAEGIPPRVAGADTPGEVLIVESDPRPARPMAEDTTPTGIGEGASVRVKGDLMVVSHRGRLFTLSLAHGGMRVIDSVEDHPKGADAIVGSPQILIVGDHVLALSWDYLDAVNVDRFKLGEDGRLSFEDRTQLSGIQALYNDSTVRVFGQKLVFFSHLSLSFDQDPMADLPGMRRWTAGSAQGNFKPLARAQDIYPGVAPDRVSERAQDTTFDALTSCDVTAPVVACSTAGVLGPLDERSALTDTAAYVWARTNQWGGVDDDEQAAKPGPGSILYRLPFDGAPPRAIAMRGEVMDAFSFQEDAKTRTLNVLVQSESKTDAQLKPAFSKDAVALLRVPLAEFGDGSREIEASRYRILPAPPWGGEPPFYFFFNRFIGAHVLYGVNRRRLPTDKFEALTVAPVSGGRPTKIYMPQEIDRFDPLGDDGLVVGVSEVGEHERLVLHFGVLDLSSEAGARLGDFYVHPLAPGDYIRSGFFYRPDPGSPGGDTGILGFAVPPHPIDDAGLERTSMSVEFLRRDGARISPFGALSVKTPAVVDPGCNNGSCQSWYEGPRPLFIHGRIFALIGYELLEGRITPTGIQEIGRLNFAPGGGRQPGPVAPAKAAAASPSSAGGFCPGGHGVCRSAPTRSPSCCGGSERRVSAPIGQPPADHRDHRQSGAPCEKCAPLTPFGHPPRRA